VFVGGSIQWHDDELALSSILTARFCTARMFSFLFSFPLVFILPFLPQVEPLLQHSTDFAFPNLWINHTHRRSSVGLQGEWPSNQVSINLTLKLIRHLLQSVRTAPGAHLLFNGYRRGRGGGGSLVIKRPGRQNDHSPQTTPEIKNAWSHTSTLHTV
jgi:hypothetical protein